MMKPDPQSQERGLVNGIDITCSMHAYLKWLTCHHILVTHLLKFFKKQNARILNHRKWHIYENCQFFDRRDVTNFLADYKGADPGQPVPAKTTEKLSAGSCYI